jgi:hypothetical protein
LTSELVVYYNLDNEINRQAVGCPLCPLTLLPVPAHALTHQDPAMDSAPNARGHGWIRNSFAAELAGSPIF